MLKQAIKNLNRKNDVKNDVERERFAIFKAIVGK